MQKQNIGNWIIVILALLNIVLWIIFPPPDTLDTSYSGQFAGEILASTAIILFAIAIVLSTRIRRLEPYFGGLDQMYQTHKQVAIAGFFLLVAHFFVIPDSGMQVIGRPLGMLAFVGIILIVFLSIAPRVPLISRLFNLPYNRWRILHKLLGLFFVLGLIHYLLVGTISSQTIPGVYMLLFGVIGIMAWLYKLIFAGRAKKIHTYTVSQVRRLNGTCSEIIMEPQGNPIDFEAGQFVFVHFDGDRKMKEPHPFTVSCAPGDDTLRLSIKGSGDWTRNLINELQPGMEASVEGPYGTFNYKTGGRDQLWIAGGIGVTPFISWVRDANGSLKADVDFFYGVRSEADLLFWDEFIAADEAFENFRPHLQLSSVDGHLSAENIASLTNGSIENKEIYMCGPIKMTEGFARSFRKMGVPSSQIHYEEFNFR